MTEDEMARWHHQLNGHGIELVLGGGDEQGNLTWCSPQVAELDMTEQLN